MKKVILGVLVLAVALVGFGVWKYNEKPVEVAKTDKPTIKIGATLPLSGNLAFAGSAAKASLEMMLNNEKNKNLKYNYEIVFEDNEGNVARTASTTHKLISVDNTQAVFSLWNFMGAVVANTANPKKVVNMTCSWDEDSLHGPYSFNTFSTHKQIAQLMFERLAKDNVKSVAIINEAIADTLVEYMRAEAADKNINIVAQEQITTGHRNFSAELIKANSQNPDMFIIIINPPLTYPIIKQVMELSGKKNVTAVEVFTGLDSEQKQLVNGLWFIDSNTFGSDEFQKELKKEKNIDAQSCSGNLAANLQILINAYEKAPLKGDEIIPDSDAIISYIKSNTNNFDTASGKATLMGNGLINIKPAVKKIQNGEVVKD